MNISSEEKQILYSNPFVNNELSVVLKQKNNISEKLFIVYLLMKARQDFLFFCKLFYPFCSNGNNLATHDGVKIECAVLQLHFERKIDCPIIFNTCPGHGKSTIIDVLYSAFLLFNDDKQIIRTYTSSAKTLKDNLAYFLSVVNCGLYKFGANHKKTSSNNNGYTINGFLAKAMRTIKTGIGGENATQVIVDDANDPAKIIGADFENTNNAISRSVFTRQRPRKGTRPPIFTQQRVSPIDNTAYLVKQFEKSKTKYLHIVIKQFEPQDVVYKVPLADGTQFEIIRKAGNLWDNETIMKIVNLVKADEYVYLTQYQQTPFFESDNLFKPSYFNYFSMENLPPIDYTFITTDFSFKDNQSNDYCCLCYWGCQVTNNEEGSLKKLFLLDVLYDKFPQEDDRFDILLNFFNKNINNRFLNDFGILTNIPFGCIYIEDVVSNSKIIGDAVTAFGERTIVQLKRKAMTKVTRAKQAICNICTDEKKHGCMVFLQRECELNDKLLAECLSFSRDKTSHDDFVDNFCDAIMYGAIFLENNFYF